MVSKPGSPKGTTGFKSVLIHPELYKQLAHEALDDDQKLWERTHTVLCNALRRDDLKLQSGGSLQTAR